jgi:hypothetical protein
VGECLQEGIAVSSAGAFVVRVQVGNIDGAFVLRVGNTDGTFVGTSVAGALLGNFVGALIGALVGSRVNCKITGGFRSIEHWFAVKNST